MFSAARQLRNFGVNSMRSLAAKLSTPQTEVSKILKVAAIHNRFLAQGGGHTLGPPISDVIFADGTAEREYFSGAKLTLTDAGVMTQSGFRIVEVLYQGFRCDAESNELSFQDEPYFFFVVAGRLKRVGPISVDKENQYTDDHGPIINISDNVVARNLYIDIIIREHDEGDPDEAEQAVKDALTKIANDAAAVATAAENGDGVNAGEIAKYAGIAAANPMAGILAPIISSVLGLADNDVGSETVALFQPTPSGERPVTPPIIGTVHTTLQYNVVAPLIGADSGGDNQGKGVYTVYFFVGVYDPPQLVWSNEL